MGLTKITLNKLWWCSQNYGLAIITIVVIIRLFLLPFMVMQVKNMHMMREKTQIVKPEIDELKKHIKDFSPYRCPRLCNSQSMGLTKITLNKLWWCSLCVLSHAVSKIGINNKLIHLRCIYGILQKMFFSNITLTQLNLLIKQI